jgi:hypothetical protein
MWLMWGVDKAHFESKEDYILFCALAGVDPRSKCILLGEFEGRDKSYDNRDYYDWFSEDKKLAFDCSDNPLENGWAHYF